MPPIDADQFAGYLIMQELADSTVRSYRCLYQRWIDYADDVGRDPYHPDPITVRAWSTQLAGSRSLIVQARAMIGHLCRMAGVDDCSPAVPTPRSIRKPRSRALTDDQARQLARTADRSGLAGLAVLIGLYTGARRSEIASMEWELVDFVRDEVTFVRSKTRDLHTVPLHPHLRARLEVRAVPGERWVFPGRHGGHVAPAVIWEWSKAVSARAGVGKVTPHQWRHTLIAAVYEQGRDLLSAQDVAGHTDPQITAGYARRRDDQVRAAVESLDWLGEGA